MPDMLLLVHRIPYPPDKGDKLRSYHLLQTLRRHFSVHLGCFVDNPDDWQYVGAVEAICASTKIVKLQPRIAALRSSVVALLQNQAMSVPYFFDQELAEWVGTTLERQRIRYAVVFSSPMAQYVLRASFELHRVMDFVDVDSEKWSQYSQSSFWPLSWFYSREARMLAAYERKVATVFDGASFVTPDEAELFGKVSPDTHVKHRVVPNGVDTTYFDPGLDFVNPFTAEELPIVFTGTMSYRPNIDGVTWFAKKVLPTILSRQPKARLWIVGADPHRDVRALETRTGVVVTGRVADVRPFLRHAVLAVAPLRIARGIQNKVLEAMAMDCPVLCSEEAAAGFRSPLPAFVARSEEQFAAHAVALLSDRGRKDRNRVRQYVLDHYDWETNLDWFVREGMTSARHPSASEWATHPAVAG